MSNLAVSNDNTIDIKNFDMNSFFYTDSFLFKKLKLDSTLHSFVEAVFALLLLILFSPIMITVAIVIKINMPGPIFYSQTRVGKNGKNFKILKFRSMIINAESSTGAILATKHDPRITKLGSFLRASHLDEFPQLINVLLGDMSFVGPRPERPEFVSDYEVTIANYSRRREVKPGITGLAQVCLPYDATAKEKLQYDIYYIDQKNSVLFNILITYYTGIKMLNFSKFLN